jgi:hypothetical protein
MARGAVAKLDPLVGDLGKATAKIANQPPDSVRDRVMAALRRALTLGP